MKVIRRTVAYRCECDNCGAILEFTTDDVKQAQTEKMFSSVYCPVCGYYIAVSRGEFAYSTRLCPKVQAVYDNEAELDEG